MRLDADDYLKKDALEKFFKAINQDQEIDIDFNSADSVAYHLAVLIPIPWIHKQNLLEAYDASQRLNILSKYIEEISTK